MAAEGKKGLRVVDQQKAQRSKRRRGFTKDEQLMQRAALEKFPPDRHPPYRSDRAVAKKLGISSQSVCDLVRGAFEHRLVSPLHNLPVEEIQRTRLENALEQKYGLQRVRLVPGLPCMLGDLTVDERRNVQTQVIRSMARHVVEHVDGLLANAAAERETFTLGVAWGRTMRLLVEQLLSTPRAVSFPGLEVVPIIGITCASLREPTQANVIAMRFAEAYQGHSSQLACPAFVPQNDVWIVTQRLEQVRRMLKKLPTCDAVLTSMGPIPDDDNAAEEITLSSERELNEELFKAARTWNAVGEICYWLFNEQGAEVKTNHTAVGLGFEGLRTIAANPDRQVILVAGGDRRRFKPLRAALRAKLASVLVSDTVTAQFLAEES